LRDEMAAGTELGKTVKDLIASGALVSDEIVTAMVRSRLSKADVQAKGVMLDGYPRTVAQAESLSGILAETGMEMGGAVLIDAPREILLRRLTGRRLCTNKECGAIYNINDVAPKVENVCDKCGSPLYQRSDDSEATVLGRLKVYDEQTFPVIDYYARRGELITVTIEDAPIEHNFARLCKVMGI
ncbi:MAG: nucleoside monophosphate kinase, partial [Victivallales bacterium]|nr:nucleoside monophosphate kinase [Victivallales bacterium]